MTVMQFEIPMILSEYQYMYFHGWRVSVETILHVYVCSFSNAICFETVHSFRSKKYQLPNKYAKRLLFLTPMRFLRLAVVHS